MYNKPGAGSERNIIDDYSNLVVNRVLSQVLNIEEGVKIFSYNLLYFAAAFTSKEEFENAYNHLEIILKELIIVIDEITEARSIMPFSPLILSLFLTVNVCANK